MITINTISKQIKTCKGDSFYTYFQVKGYKLKGDEVITFAVRKTIDGTTSPIVSERCDIAIRNNIICVYVAQNKMSALKIGEYYYDISLKRPDGFHISLTSASKLFVLGVAHND